MQNFTLFISILFLFSCGGSKKSTQGSWTKNDLQKCKKDLLEGMKSTEEFEMFESLGEDMNQVASCMCKQVEDMYSSYIIADLRIDSDISEDDAGMMMIGCMSETIQELYQLGLEMEQTPVDSFAPQTQ